LHDRFKRTWHGHKPTFVVLKFSQGLPTFPPRPSSLPLGSNTKENCWKTAERNIEKSEAQKPQFLYTGLCLDLMVNCWSPLTHASHCMTTSKPGAATQTTDKVSPFCRFHNN